MTKPLFVTNEAVISQMGLVETTNDKGRKILVSDDIPFTLTRWEIGKLQSENLRGRTTTQRTPDGKKPRGHLFDLKTIRRLRKRYGTDGTDGTLGTDTEGPETAKIHAQNDSKKQPSPPLGSVPGVPNVPTDFVCPTCGLDCKDFDTLERHAVQKHQGRPVIAEWQKKHERVNLGEGPGKGISTREAGS